MPDDNDDDDNHTDTDSGPDPEESFWSRLKSRALPLIRAGAALVLAVDELIQRWREGRRTDQEKGGQP